MNNKRYQLMIDFNKIILNFIVVYAFASAFIILFTEKNYGLALKALCLFPVPILSHAIYTFTKNKWSYILFHLLLLLLYVVLFQDGMLRFVSCVYVLFSAVYKLVVKTELDKNASLIPAAAFFILILYCNFAIEHFLFSKFYFTLAICYVILYFLYMYLVNYKNYFEIYADVNNIPIKEIKYANNTMILVFVLICLFLMFLFTFIPINEFFSYIGTYIQMLFVKFVKFILSLFHMKDKQNIMAPDDPVSQITIKPSDNGANNFFDNLMILLRAPVTFALIGYAIYKITKLYHKKEKNKKPDLKYSPPNEKREKLEIKPKIDLQKITSLFTHTNNGKIRKLFYQAVLKRIGSSKLTKDLAPIQLSKYALKAADGRVPNSEDEQKLTEYYEQARYSAVECSSDDLQSVKNMLK